MAAKPAEQGDMALFLWGATRGLQPCALLIAIRGGGDLHARGLGARSPSRACPQTPSHVLLFGPRLPSLPWVFSWLVCVWHHWGRGWTAVLPVQCQKARSGGLSCFWPVLCVADSRLLLPLGSGCRLVAHTEAWPPLTWPLPGRDSDLVQEGPPPGTEEGLNLLQGPALGLRHAAAGEHQVHQADGGKEEERHLEAEGVHDQQEGLG